MTKSPSRKPSAPTAVGYVRVSTDAQAEDGFGLDVQRAAIRAWAKSTGHRLVEMFADEGQSGSNGLDTRVGLADAIALIRSGKAGTLVVYRLDRLARDLVLQETLLGEIRRAGGDVSSTSAGENAYLADDPDDPSRRLIRQVLGAVAEYERSLISMRLRAGRRRKAEKGGYAFGSPPFGSRAELGTLVADPEEAAVVDRIERLATAGLSIRSIAARLNEEGAASKRGGSWHPATVSRVLARIDSGGPWPRL